MYIRHFKLVLQCLHKRKLYLKLKKCQFKKKENYFLDFIIRQTKI